MIEDANAQFNAAFSEAALQMAPLIVEWLEKTLAPCIRRYGFVVDEPAPNCGEPFGYYLQIEKGEFTMWVGVDLLDSAMYDGSVAGASFRLNPMADISDAEGIDTLSHFPFQYTNKAWSPLDQIQKRWHEFLQGVEPSTYADDLADWVTQNTQAREAVHRTSHSVTVLR